MVDVSGKPSSTRTAIARGVIAVSPDTRRRIEAGENRKGDVIAISIIAGITAAKQTSSLIPLCHALPIESVAVTFVWAQTDVEVKPSDDRKYLQCEAVVRTSAKTGVEMEALTAVSIALLTVYDMCKANDHAMVIQGVELVEKTGGTKPWSR